MPVVPQIGQPAPAFTAKAVVNGQFKDVKLEDYKGNDRVEEFRNYKCEVLAASTDSHFSHLAWLSVSRKSGGLGNLNIPLLADKSCEIARAYGCLKEDEGIAFRGLYIIDDKGILRQITINDLPVGRSVDETLRLVEAFQYTDTHGEVCPAGWKPGDPTIKPTPENAKEYFSQVAEK